MQINYSAGIFAEDVENFAAYAMLSMVGKHNNSHLGMLMARIEIRNIGKSHGNIVCISARNEPHLFVGVYVIAGRGYEIPYGKSRIRNIG